MLEVSQLKVVVKIENHKAMQNHIGQVHACAMALIAEQRLVLLQE